MQYAQIHTEDGLKPIPAKKEFEKREYSLISFERDRNLFRVVYSWPDVPSEKGEYVVATITEYYRFDGSLVASSFSEWTSLPDFGD